MPTRNGDLNALQGGTYILELERALNVVLSLRAEIKMTRKRISKGFMSQSKEVPWL